MPLSKDFANPIVVVIEALASDDRRRIIIDLHETGSLSYSKIRERTGLSKGTLNYHLKKLSSAGMIRNHIHDEVQPYSSYYEVSEFGASIIDNLLASFRPPIHAVISN